MQELLSQLPPESSNSLIAKNNIFYEVMGLDLHGHCRTYGHGPSPKDVFESRRFQIGTTDYENLRNKIREELRTEMEAELTKKLEERLLQIESRFSMVHNRREIPSGASDFAPHISLDPVQVRVINCLLYIIL